MKRRAALGQCVTQAPAREAESIDRDRRQARIQQIRQLLWREIDRFRSSITIMPC